MQKGNFLQLALVKAGISQVQAAKHFDVNISTVQRQCKGSDPKLSTILKYAALCNVKVSEMIAMSE